MTTEPDPMMSDTAQGLIAFLEWASRTGELAPNTAAAYKTAVTKVLEIDGEAWTTTNIGELDIARQLDRFARLRANRYNAPSLRTYGNRFSAAITHYRKYLEDPSGFRSSQPKVARGKGMEKPQPASTAGPKDHGRDNRLRTAAPGPGIATEPSDLVQYPFPLRVGVMAYLSLPRDLRHSEAQRVATFVASLAIDPTPDTTSELLKEP